MNDIATPTPFYWNGGIEPIADTSAGDKVVDGAETPSGGSDDLCTVIPAAGRTQAAELSEMTVAPPPVTGDANLASEPPSAGLPTSFGEALHQIADRALFDSERMRRLRSDITVAAKMMRSTINQLPCEPVQLRPMLRRVLPARFRIKPKRWSSIKSSLTRVLKITGWHEADDVLLAPLIQEWQTGCDLLPECPQRAVFGHFARFCQRSGLRPAEVSAQTLEAYRIWKASRTLELDVAHHATAVRRQWNWLVSHHPAWPQCRLERPRLAREYGLHLEDLHPSLRAEIEQCCASMAQFTPLSSRNTRVYSPQTIHGSCGILLRAAAVVIQNGADSDSLRSLHDILEPAAIRRVLEDHAQRVGKGVGWAPSSATVAITLKRMARVSGALTEAEMGDVARLCGMVKARPPRLTATARERLAAFDEPAVLRRFLRLATRCFETADWMLRQARQTRGGSERKAARLHQKGLALATLICKPLRREDLAELDLATDFRRDSKGRIVGLCIPGRKTKSGRDEEAIFELPLIRRFEKHLKLYWPILCEGDSTYLFPGRINGHRSPSNMSFELKRLVQNEVGAEFNVHLVRHLAASMLLEADPRNMVVAQRLIGHGQLKTTERFHGAARTRGAQRDWGQVLQRKMAQLERRGRS